MAVNANAALEITAFKWVPDFAQGFVRDLRPRWACEEIGMDYSERLLGLE
ncbi:MAG: glutathione S-transferase family protein, partial [Gammaproteobacteria bacterium]